MEDHQRRLLSLVSRFGEHKAREEAVAGLGTEAPDVAEVFDLLLNDLKLTKPAIRDSILEIAERLNNGEPLDDYDNIESVPYETGEAEYKRNRNSETIKVTLPARLPALGMSKAISGRDVDEAFDKFEDWRKAALPKYITLLRKKRADELTDVIRSYNERLASILTSGIEFAEPANWDELIKTRRAALYALWPKEPTSPRRPATQKFAPPKISLLNRLLGKRAEIEFQARVDFDKQVQDEDRRFRSSVSVYEAREREWREQTATITANFRAFQQSIQSISEAIQNGGSEATAAYIAFILDRWLLTLVAWDDVGSHVEYHPGERLLVVDMQLPSTDGMPRFKEARVTRAGRELEIVALSDRDASSLYESLNYQICLRTLHEVFAADAAASIDRVLFNGYVERTDRGSGRTANVCIMSVVSDRGTFLEIDLSRVDVKVCFKKLKGISASSLYEVAPVAPVLALNKVDGRFIEARDAISGLDGATNLAAMDWQEFEHLVRGVFEKEFAARGGEVKITQSSSDGGVDAVAFDPDPITGGKIVIQAKRYTRTVGVSAVRDLYGVVEHESASRGILVTTSDFGPDAHKFVANKRITLMGGANLLHLLEKHGISAKIDIAAARRAYNA